MNFTVLTTPNDAKIRSLGSQNITMHFNRPLGGTANIAIHIVSTPFLRPCLSHQITPSACKDIHRRSLKTVLKRKGKEYMRETKVSNLQTRRLKMEQKKGNKNKNMTELE